MKAGVVAQVILRAATTRPRLRYLVGQDAKMLMLLKRVLPGLLFEGLLRRTFQTEKTVPALAQPQKAVSD